MTRADLIRALTELVEEKRRALREWSAESALTQTEAMMNYFNAEEALRRVEAIKGDV